MSTQTTGGETAPDADPTVYLIDGTAYIHRAFHAIQGLTNSKGLPTNAVFGFARMILRLMEEKAPAFAAMVFDAKGPTFRHELYGQYKANRPPHAGQHGGADSLYQGVVPRFPAAGDRAAGIRGRRSHRDTGPAGPGRWSSGGHGYRRQGFRAAGDRKERFVGSHERKVYGPGRGAGSLRS